MHDIYLLILCMKITVYTFNFHLDKQCPSPTSHIGYGDNKCNLQKTDKLRYSIILSILMLSARELQEKIEYHRLTEITL